MKSEKNNPKRSNDILDIVGKDGWWQKSIFLWLVLEYFILPSQFMAMSFYAPILSYWCAGAEHSNWTVEEWKDNSLPENKQCFRYVSINSSGTIQDNQTLTSSGEVVACDSWEYDTSFYSSTVLSEFDLVCEKEWLVSLSTFVFHAGRFVSNFVIGHLADRFGRKPLIAASVIIQVFASVACAFSTSFAMFVATRFLTAFGLSGTYSISYVLLMEICGPKQRSFYGVAVNFGWCVGFVSFAGIAWLLRDWFWIQVAITAPMMLFLFTCWLLPESPRWLISKGRTREAEKVMKRAAEMNGKDLSNMDEKLQEVIMEITEVGESSTERHTIIDLFVTPGLTKMTLIVFFMWFSGMFVYYGLSYNTNELAGDPFVNFALSGAVEFPATLLGMIVIYKHGRRLPLALTMGVGGLICVLSFLFPSELWWFTTVISMIGKFCITISLSIFFVYTTELFPTAVRSIGLGSALVCSNIASALAPFVKELGHATYPAVPQVLFGILTLLSGSLILMLPETSGVKIPDTLSEAVPRRNSNKNKERNEHEMLNPQNSSQDYKLLTDVTATDSLLDAPAMNKPVSIVAGSRENGNS